MAKIDKLVKQAQEHFEPNEKIIASVLGAYESKIMGSDTIRNGVFIATDRRIIFFGKKMFGYDLEIFPYSTISSIEVGKGLMGHTISFFASGNKVKMKWINQGEVSKFMEEVQARIGKKSETVASPLSDANMDSLDQLKKLAELRDAGIITEEEFNMKKKKLLDI